MNNEHHKVSVIPVEGGHDVTYKGDTYAVRSDWALGQQLFSGTINGEDIFVQVERKRQLYSMFYGGSQADVMIITERMAELLHPMPIKAPPDMSKYLLSPMPGLLVSLAVNSGDSVSAGDELAVVEAMKMENTLYAERDGIVASINYETGDSLAVGDKILELE